MEKDILSFAVEKTHELIGAPTCSSETKAAAEAWLNAVGTEQEAEETKKY
ncbi:MAG: molecular chaperone Hsp90, partial [[Clostridium] symbiosum]